MESTFTIYSRIKSILFKMFFLAVTVLCTTDSYGQNIEQKPSLLKKNSLYGGFGICGTCTAIYGSYERIVKQDRRLSYFVKTAIGKNVSLGDIYNFVAPQLGILTGAKSNHMELSVGPLFHNSNSRYHPPKPVSGYLGYRYQKPQGYFQLRIGIGNPEGLTMSLGVAF